MDIYGKFFNVGHGLTYAFKLSSYHVLFDIKNTTHIYKDLEIFYGNTQIDSFIISHFHEDHMDGLQKLYDKGFNIKKIYIPYIDSDEDFLLKLNKYYKHGISPITAPISGRDRLPISNNRDVEVIEVDSSLTVKVPVSYSSKDFWEFHIHQSRGNAPSVVSKILKDLAYIGIKTKEDVLSNLYRKSNAIKKVYQNAIRNLNLTSIFMVHGPINSSYIQKQF